VKFVYSFQISAEYSVIFLWLTIKVQIFMIMSIIVLLLWLQLSSRLWNTSLFDRLIVCVLIDVLLVYTIDLARLRMFLLLDITNCYFSHESK